MTEATARSATAADIPYLVEMYRELEREMIALKAIWRLTDGLAEPLHHAFEAHLATEHGGLYVGEYHLAPVGFLMWAEEPLLPQSGGLVSGVIRLIFTLPQARRVGVGEAMAERFLREASAAGIDLFDAIVPPGHRHAKNFFESLGFKARRIVMHRDDRKEA